MPSTPKPTAEGSEGAKSYRVPIALRFDLIPPVALRRLAAIYEEGAQTYGEVTYLSRQLPMSVVINHLLNHLTLHEIGDRSEDHFAKVAWAAFTLMALEEAFSGETESEAQSGAAKRVFDVNKFGAGSFDPGVVAKLP